MSEQVAGGLDLYLKIGLAVSVQGRSEEEKAATVVSISPGKLELELSTPPSQVPFQEGEKVGSSTGMLGRSCITGMQRLSRSPDLTIGT